MGCGNGKLFHPLLKHFCQVHIGFTDEQYSQSGSDQCPECNSRVNSIRLPVHRYLFHQVALPPDMQRRVDEEIRLKQTLLMLTEGGKLENMSEMLQLRTMNAVLRRGDNSEASIAGHTREFQQVYGVTPQEYSRVSLQLGSIMDHMDRVSTYDPIPLPEVVEMEGEWVSDDESN